VSGRLADKIAVVVGAGQTPGDTIGNGRAAALLFAREGARVVAIDRDRDSADETAAMIAREGGASLALAADATSEPEFRGVVERVVRDWTRIDVLHNNVGIGAGDAAPEQI